MPTRRETAQPMLTDAKLLTQLQTGDEASFEPLFLRHYDRVYGILYRLLGNRADAEDAAQHVFLKLYHTPERIRLQNDGSSLAGWLYRVAVNTGYNTLRSRKRRYKWHIIFARFWPGDGASVDPAHLAESKALQISVRDTLAKMKPRDAKLLLLRHSGLSYKELAVILNVAPGSIGPLLTRAEHAFEKEYRLAFPEEEYPNET